MNHNEITKVQAYLRQTFGNDEITLKAPDRPHQPAEMYIGDEFIGVIYRDVDEGEVSYALNISILEEDLPD
jgi:predicted RNA-binding protein (virulence factor B family)